MTILQDIRTDFMSHGRSLPGRGALTTLLLAAVVSLSACATAQRPFAPHADWERGADLAPGKSFVVVRSPLLPETLDEDQTKLVSVIESVLHEELAKKGYKSGPAESAQLIVTFHTLKQARKNVEVRPRECMATREPGVTDAAAQSQSMMLACEESIITNYDEGTLIVDVFDAQSRELLWHGWASGEAPDRGDDGTPALVAEVTRDILSRFPPR